MQACLVFCRFAFCVCMADIVEQLPLEALGKILTCLGVRYFRSFKRRLTLAKRYSEDFSAFFRLMLQGENTEPKYRNLVVRYHVQWIATADHHPIVRVVQCAIVRHYVQWIAVISLVW